MSKTSESKVNGKKKCLTSVGHSHKKSCQPGMVAPPVLPALWKAEASSRPAWGMLYQNQKVR